MAALRFCRLLGFAVGAVASLACPAAAAVPTTAAENARAGTLAWYRAQPSQERIAGYAEAPSYLRGQTVRLFVDSHGRAFGFRVFRLGWYHGRTGRLVTSGRVSGNPPEAAPRIFGDRPG